MRKLGKSPLLSSSSDASIDEKKQEQSSRIGNTSWFQYGKCYEKETGRKFSRYKSEAALQKCSGEHLCRSVTSIKLLSNFIEITLRHLFSLVNLQHIFRTSFPKNTSGGLHLTNEILKNQFRGMHFSRRISITLFS